MWEIVKISRFSDELWNFWDSDESFSSGVTKLKQKSRGKKWGNSFLRRGNSLFFQDPEWTFFNFSGEVRQNCQNCIQPSLGRFRGKTLYEAINKVSNLFALWAKNLKPFFGKFLSGLSELQSARPEKLFTEIHFFQKSIVFCINFGSPVTFFVSWQINYLVVSN